MIDPSKRNIRLLLAYDGSDFCGWQRQAKQASIQGELESALGKLHKHQVSLIGSGRTDAGVHAVGQVANFYSDIRAIPPQNFVPALNRLLPRAIRVLDARQCLDDFHARFDAKARTYRYTLICGRSALPMELRYAWQLWRQPSLPRLNALAAVLYGETDCSLFTLTGDPSLSRMRYISLAHFFMEGDRLIFEIRANAFLWKMARSIVGSLLQFEERGLSAAEFAAILASGRRCLAGVTAPAQGLCLQRIDFFTDGF